MELRPRSLLFCYYRPSTFVGFTWFLSSSSASLNIFNLFVLGVEPARSLLDCR